MWFIFILFIGFGWLFSFLGIDLENCFEVFCGLVVIGLIVLAFLGVLHYVN